jgi:hypothetical protein
MADEAQDKKAAAPAANAPAEKVKKKKLQPTNCAQSNKRIRRKDWYFRDGSYFANKQAFALWKKQKAEKAAKAKEAEAAAAAKAPEASQA